MSYIHEKTNPKVLFWEHGKLQCTRKRVHEVPHSLAWFLGGAICGECLKLLLDAQQGVGEFLVCDD